MRMNRRLACLHFSALACTCIATTLAIAAEPLQIQRSTIVQGDADWDWTQARTAIVPGDDEPFFLTTMSRTAKVGAHGYHDGYEVVAGDLYPVWHAATGKVLITGKSFNFAGGSKEDILREQVVYCVFDPQTRQFGPLATLAMPEQDHATLGNSGVCRIDDNESWITVAEGRVSYGKRNGETNRVILAKLRPQ